MSPSSSPIDEDTDIAVAETTAQINTLTWKPACVRRRNSGSGCIRRWPPEVYAREPAKTVSFASDPYRRVAISGTA